MQNNGSNAGNAAETQEGAQRAKPAADSGASAHTDKWPPQLLQASGFRPNPAPPESEPRRRNGRKALVLFALVGLAAGAGWSTAHVWVPSGLARMVATGSPARQASVTQPSAQSLEMRKLALVESSTMARVLSDLRILQSAFANLQGQVANLPPRSDLDGIMRTISGLQKSIATVSSRVTLEQKHQATVMAGLSEKIAAASAANAKTTDELTGRIDRLEKMLASRSPVASTTSTRVERTASVTENAAGQRKTRFGYMVRDVQRGVAIVENRAGHFLEVYPGMYIPGAGRVRAIQRRGGQWVVLTTRGTIDSRPY